MKRPGTRFQERHPSVNAFLMDDRVLWASGIGALASGWFVWFG